MSKSIYTVEEEPIVLSKHLLDIFLLQDDPANLLSLYCFYYYTAKWQQTNKPHATNEYVAKGLKWGIDKVKKYRGQLLDLNLIESITQKDKTNNKIIGHFIKINFVWKKVNVDKISTGVISPLVAESTTNALSANKGNALSTNIEESTHENENTLLKKISQNQFERFWKHYPKRDGRGAALTAWNKLCLKKNRPIWKDLIRSLLSQIESERWQDIQFIPHASTWINQSRWLDDSELMIVYKRTNNSAKNNFDDDKSYEDQPLPDHILKQQKANLRKAQND